MFMYLRVDHWLAAMWRSLAAARFRQLWPSGNAPTTRVRRRIGDGPNDEFAVVLSKPVSAAQLAQAVLDAARTRRGRTA